MISLWSVVLYILTVPLTVLVCLWGWYNWHNRRLLSVARTLPTPLPTLPLLGNIHFFIWGIQESTASLMRALSAPTSSNKCVWFGPVPKIIICKTEDIQRCLNNSKTLAKALEYDLFSDFFVNGILTAPVNVWKHTRRNINPIFHPRNVEHLIPFFNLTSDQLIEDLSAYVGEEQVDISSCVSLMALTDTLGLVFGAKALHAQNGSAMKEISSVFDRIHNAITRRLQYIWLQMNFVSEVFYREHLQTLDNLWSQNGIMNKLLLEVLKSTDNLNDVDDNQCHDMDTSPKKATCKRFMTLTGVLIKLLKEDERFDENYMRQEIHTTMAAGSDTVQIIISSCLLALGSHPHIQETLYGEIMRIVGHQPKTYHLTVDDVSQMTYIDQVLKETMRRFNAVPVIGRKPSENIQLSDGKIPKDASIIISLIGLHMDPTIFPDPQRFDPDRFSPENVAKMERYSFLPFSAGPRNCVGQHYAMLMMKITLVRLLRHYIVHSDVNINKMKFTFGMSVYSEDGYYVRLTKRGIVNANHETNIML